MTTLQPVTGNGGRTLEAGPSPAPSTPKDDLLKDRSLPRSAVFVPMGLKLAIRVFFGAQQVSVTAFVVEHGAPGATVPIFAVSQLQRSAGRLAVRTVRVARVACHSPVQLLAATGALMPGTLLLAHGRLTVRARIGRGPHRCHAPASSGALLRAHRVDRPLGRPDPDVRLARLRRRGGLGCRGGSLRHSGRMKPSSPPPGQSPNTGRLAAPRSCRSERPGPADLRAEEDIIGPHHATRGRPTIRSFRHEPVLGLCASCGCRTTPRPGARTPPAGADPQPL